MPNDMRELLRSNYLAFGHGDIEPLIASLTDDISWSDSTIGPLAGEYTGKDQILRFFGKMLEVYGDTLRLEFVDVIANDYHGVVLTRESGAVDGVGLEWNGVHVWSFRDGRCATFISYADAAYQRFWSTRREDSSSERTP